ncbi:MAG: GNAT family N-acetyltransferase [Treponema sp.]|nr:GNAT family N-acetyltransferase [Treponema sp.]
MAEIHVFGWRCAYKDFISMEHLVNVLTVKVREERFREYISDPNNKDKILICEESNMIKGFMTIGDCRDEDKGPDTYELHGIYIDPLFQRQGIGTEFVSRCIEEAKNRGKKEITLWVFQKNENSINFYRKMGFIPDGKVIVKLVYNENAIRMRMEVI